MSNAVNASIEATIQDARKMLDIALFQFSISEPALASESLCASADLAIEAAAKARGWTSTGDHSVVSEFVERLAQERNDDGFLHGYSDIQCFRANIGVDFMEDPLIHSSLPSARSFIRKILAIAENEPAFQFGHLDPIEKHLRETQECLKLADSEFSAGRPRQGSAKLWEASCHSVSALAATYGASFCDRDSYLQFVETLTRRTDDHTIAAGFACARTFQANIQRDFLNEDQIKSNRPIVHRFIDEMLKMVDRKFQT